jgi:hypothetical protein
VDNSSLSQVEPVSIGASKTAGKTFVATGDRVMIFDHFGCLRGAETQAFRLHGRKAAKI